MKILEAYMLLKIILLYNDSKQNCQKVFARLKNFTIQSV